MQARVSVPLKTLPMQNIKKLTRYIQTPYCLKKALFTYLGHLFLSSTVKISYMDYKRFIQLGFHRCIQYTPLKLSSSKHPLKKIHM